MMGANVEAALGYRVVIVAGVTYSPATTTQAGTAQPSVLARVQILDQARHGIDGAVSVGYGRDCYVDEQGLFVASLAAGWRSERTALLANLGYGQDGEGDDHEGDLRLAGLYRVTRHLHVGLDARLRKMLRTTDPKTLGNVMGVIGVPELEFTAGPVAALTAGLWGLLVESGVNAVRQGTLRTGAIVVGGGGRGVLSDRASHTGHTVHSIGPTRGAGTGAGTSARAQAQWVTDPGSFGTCWFANTKETFDEQETASGIDEGRGRHLRDSALAASPRRGAGRTGAARHWAVRDPARRAERCSSF